MRILVTGGAGFIGSNFVRMASKGFFSEVSSILVLDKLTYAGNLSNLNEVLNLPNFKFIAGDICDSVLVGELVRNVDAIVNFAAESHVDKSIYSPEEFIRTNVLGVHVLLEAIRNSRASVRFIQVSTDEVYGSISSGSWNENCPLLPNSPYSASKASGELIARSYFITHQLDVRITRSSNNYGTFHYPEKLIPLFITNLLENKKVPIYGSGLNVRDWLHVNDHCHGIYKVLLNGKPGDIYNIGGGLEMNNLEITRKILELLGKDESHIEFVPDRKGHDFRYSVDWSKIERELDYKPTVSFELGLRNTIEWYKENECWWRPLKEVK